MKSIVHEYIQILKSQSFKQWELAQLGRHETVNTQNEHYNCRVKG